MDLNIKEDEKKPKRKSTKDIPKWKKKIEIDEEKKIEPDDTGARHNGKNGYCTQIGNEFMETQKLPQKWLSKLENIELSITDKEKFNEWLVEVGIVTPKNIRIVNSFKNNKSDLLKVLEKPYLLLHNNLSERDIRDYVKKRKISGSTRSENGRKARDTFASLKKTCKKLGISFLAYLKDRVLGDGKIPCLGESVRVAISRTE